MLYKKLFIFLIIILLPTKILATECTLNETNDGCVSYDGCYFQAAAGILDANDCRPCLSGYYNTNDLQNPTSCTQCPMNYDITQYPGKIPDTDAQANGQSECPWKCDANYYKDGDHCEACPDHSTSVAGSENISQCECNSGFYSSNSVHDGTFECLACPDSSTPTHFPDAANIDNCTCASNSQLIHNGTDDTWYCGTCNGQYNSNYHTCQECGPNATLDQSTNQCTCNTGYYGDGFTCQQCDTHATFSNNTCKCNAGYYGDGFTCQPCPYGKTSTAGATHISNCNMNMFTKFCDGEGNCMYLIANNCIPCYNVQPQNYSSCSEYCCSLSSSPAWCGTTSPSDDPLPEAFDTDREGTVP